MPEEDINFAEFAFICSTLECCICAQRTSFDDVNIVKIAYANGASDYGFACGKCVESLTV